MNALLGNFPLILVVLPHVNTLDTGEDNQGDIEDKQGDIIGEKQARMIVGNINVKKGTSAL